MRSFKAQDHWRRVYEQDYPSYFSGFDFKGFKGIDGFEGKKGITVFCGLNGAGKSTILSVIKDIAGIPQSIHDAKKTKGSEAIGNFYLEREISCQNKDNQRLINNGWTKDKLQYFDAEVSEQFQNYCITQDNFDELLEGEEGEDCSEKEVEEINYCIGKCYSKVTVTTLSEAMDGIDVPFFQVEDSGISYDSRTMGKGEHFLLFMFWCVKKLNSNSICFIEEPETYISIFSQRHFMDYLAKVIHERKVSVYLTTHSPYILQNIQKDRIYWVLQNNGSIQLIQCDGDNNVNKYLGIDHLYRGTIFVEDEFAKAFLLTIMESEETSFFNEYSIHVLNGYSNITNALKFIKSDNIHYQFIGVYDGDQKGKISNEGVQWGYCFLPGKIEVELTFRKYLRSPEGLRAFCESFDKKIESMRILLDRIKGADGHDWYAELLKSTSIDSRSIIRFMYGKLRETELNPAEFIKEFTSFIGK